MWVNSLVRLPSTPSEMVPSAVTSRDAYRAVVNHGLDGSRQRLAQAGVATWLYSALVAVGPRELIERKHGERQVLGRDSANLIVARVRPVPSKILASACQLLKYMRAVSWHMEKPQAIMSEMLHWKGTYP